LVPKVVIVVLVEAVVLVVVWEVHINPLGHVYAHCQ
jgi:hypothetical protein